MVSVKNPFPGMNPYLENRWGDVHSALIAYARDAIQESLPADLRARMQERVFIEFGEDILQNPRHSFSPDLHIYERSTASAVPPTEIATAAVVERSPIIVLLPDIQITESFIEIIDTGSGGRVVTTIEFVSRSNKRSGRGRRDYLRKRKESLRAQVSIVEIDLLRGGRPVTMARPEVIGPPLVTTYHACVSRAWKRRSLEYYPAPLRQRLPKVDVPLRQSDADVGLDLQWLVDEAYRKGRYDDIDYRTAPEPPFSTEDKQWVENILDSSAAS